LDLTSQPNTGDNAIHASASPFEALTERMNWLNFFADRDTFGAALTSAGVPPRTIKEWAKDPQVDIGAGEMGSLYDALECLDSDACIAKACDLWNINRPKPVGKVSGVQYDFGNQYAKIVAGTNPCHKVLETDGVLAFLADPPVCEGHTIVATKTVGFATFLDLPAGKAAELSAAQNRVSRVIMDAVGASGINVWLDSGAEAGQTVFHPHLHVVPRKAGDNLYKAPPSGAQLSDDAAKELISKIDAALHPPPPLMQPKFMRIAKIDPDSAGLNLKVKVVGDVTEVEEKKGKVFEVQVGDDSGVVTMSVSEAQKTIFTKGKVLELRNASIKMVKGHIRLLVDKWGKVSDCSDTVEVSDKKDVSATEYELVKA
jgi:diadenosine tetraphosphate (Ap4A) HIT family hydrolase